MKKQLFLLLTLLQLLAVAQKKELLLTIKEGEEFDIDNSKIIPAATGATWEITTRETKKYLLYTKTIKGKSIPVDIRQDNFLTFGREDGKEFFRINATGVKYGPFEELKAQYDEEKKILYGYSYMKDGMTYYVDVINNKTYGPFYKGGVWFADGKNLVYSNTIKNNSTQKDEVFLFENDKKYGPYEQVGYQKALSAEIAPLITYKENGRFYVNAPQCKGVSFTYWPTATELKNGWLIEGALQQKFSEKWLYLPDGTKLENLEKVKHMMNANGEIAKLEFVAGGGSDAAYKIIYKGKEIGTYAARRSNRSELYKTDFFDHILTQVQLKQNWSLALRDINYLYSPTKGLVGPFTEKELKYFSFFQDGYAVLREDSSLQINGKHVMDKVAWADFREYPVWWAFQQRGDYVYPFKNGTEVQVTEVPKRLSYFNTVEKDVIKVQRGGDFYFRLKGSDKLFGLAGQYDYGYAFSPDKKYFAFERGSDEFVVINGKPIAQGHKIIYNEKLKAFHWFIIEGQKIYMYTHKVL